MLSAGTRPWFPGIYIQVVSRLLELSATIRYTESMTLEDSLSDEPWIYFRNEGTFRECCNDTSFQIGRVAGYEDSELSKTITTTDKRAIYPPIDI